MSTGLTAFSGQIGYTFTDPALLNEALTHRSALSPKRGGKAPKGAGSNERLEFIGDRVLGLLIAEWLFERYPGEQEGALGSRLAHLVSRNVLAPIAQTLGIPDALFVAGHEEKVGIRETANVLADATEAVLGAIYLDGGLDAARTFVRTFWKNEIGQQIAPPKDPKTALQEWVLARGLALPDYEMISAEGPSHAPEFVIAVHAAGHTAQGRAGNKRLAESTAARTLLEKLETPPAQGKRKGKQP
ncbi:ribonuclease III [Acetobacter sp. AN02]|uniref:ribonuclease III n=1 Tax=Acetobacter sp. AN02 TaxID=2894186 RepID=UPI00243453F0|nr:ribonuclease III [Acetobacter sp. AN02]MDG6095377.1 ribonuclease III [Acetobacter sp. AN02]